MSVKCPKKLIHYEHHDPAIHGEVLIKVVMSVSTCLLGWIASRGTYNKIFNKTCSQSDTLSVLTVFHLPLYLTKPFSYV